MTSAYRSRSALCSLIVSLCLALSTGAALAQEREEPKPPVPPAPFNPEEEFNICPGAAPDETEDRGSAYMLVERRRPFYQIANVSVPTLAVYLPDADKANGAAILVVPGGGLSRLAIEHEGYEVSQWLNELGIAAFVLKYRVPGVGRETRWKKGVQDAQRAMSIIRSRADEWNIDPNGIGAIGFSAGAEIGTRISLMTEDEKQYAKIDSIDDYPVRPNFMLNVYPGGLTSGGFRGREPAMREDIVSRLNDKTPPMFFVHGFSDASLNSIMMTLELKKKRIPAELHIFQDGARGFGARESGSPLAIWPELAESWMASLGYLDPPHVRSYPASFTAADESGATLPRISEAKSNTSLDEAYMAQRRIVELSPDEIGGYKGAISSAAAQVRNSISEPVHCVLFQPSLLQGSDNPSLSLADLGPTVVETELGYIMGVDISSKIADPDVARLASQAVVAAFDVPTNLGERMSGRYSATDFVASNCGNQTNIIVGSRFHPDDYNLDELEISLTLDGETIHETTGDVSKGGQWQNLMTLINQIIDKGHTIHEGDLILSGSLGSPIPAKAGTYTANYGDLGTVEFEIK